MKQKNFLPKISLLVLAVLALQLLFSCGTPQKDSQSSAPAMSSVATQPPVVTPPAPSAEPTPTEQVSKIPAEWKDNGIFSDYYEKAYAQLEKLTLREKIGQMLLVRCPQAGALDFIKDYQPGGLVLFEVDFTGKTMDDVIGMIESYQNAAKLPMIMATDEEGGSVIRISRNTNLADHTFRSPQKLYNKGGLAAVRDDTLIKAALLKKLGLNLNLAPVADVSVNPGDYIYARAFGRPAAETGDYVATVVKAMREYQLSSALKHFPGYGGNTDTHTGIAVDDRPYSAFAESDFIPFKAGIASGAESILVSHNIVSCMDKAFPASLSPSVHNILRNTLDFTGIIITDDLSMAAIKAYTGSSSPSVKAVLAGNDMLILQDYESVSASLLAAVNTGEIAPALIDRAVFRILAWKMSSGLQGENSFE